MDSFGNLPLNWDWYADIYRQIPIPGKCLHTSLNSHFTGSFSLSPFNSRWVTDFFVHLFWYHRLELLSSPRISRPNPLPSTVISVPWLRPSVSWFLRESGVVKFEDNLGGLRPTTIILDPRFLEIYHVKYPMFRLVSYRLAFRLLPLFGSNWPSPDLWEFYSRSYYI